MKTIKITMTKVLIGILYICIFCALFSCYSTPSYSGHYNTKNVFLQSDSTTFRAKIIRFYDYGNIVSMYTEVIKIPSGNMVGDTIYHDNNSYVLTSFIKRELKSTHKCSDSTHKTCDGNCECDGMDCK